MFNQGGLFQDTSGAFKKTLSVNPITGKAGGFEHGDKIILPDDVLQSLLARDIAYPMLFKLQTLDKKSIYCGVSEFTAETGQAYLPQWMMTQLGLKQGNNVELFNVMLQKGQYLLLRPHTYRFVKRFEDPKTIFEMHINKYATLTRGTTIQICAGGEVWYFDIMDLKPARAVCIIDTDLKMDFDEPRDIKEYEEQLKQQAEDRKIRDKFAIAANDYQTEQLLSPSANNPASPHFNNNSPYIGSTPMVEPQHNSGGFDGATIFADASDGEDNPTPLSVKLGGQGMSLKRNAVTHGAPGTTPSQTQPSSVSTARPSTTTANKNVVFGGPAATTTTPASTSLEDEAAKKKERDRLIRLQRAALYTRGKPTTTTTTTTTSATALASQSQPQQPQFSKAEKELLGLDKVPQQGTSMASFDQAMNDAAKADGAEDKVGYTTEQQGDWIFYKDAQGRLIRKEEAKKTFAMSGVGNSLKR